MAITNLKTRISQLDQTVVGFLRRWSVTFLRVSLGLIFIWFGSLKIFGVTPVNQLVEDTVYWVDPDWFVPFLGAVEAVVGLGLLLRRAMRVILALFAGQMVGTFLVLITLPEVAFSDNPFQLTAEGQYVLKNLVLLSAGLVIGSTVGSAISSKERVLP